MADLPEFLPGHALEVVLDGYAVETRVLRARPPRLWIRRPRLPLLAAAPVEQVGPGRLRFRPPAPDPLAPGNVLELRAVLDGRIYQMQAEVVGCAGSGPSAYLTLYVHQVAVSETPPRSRVLAAEPLAFGPREGELPHRGTAVELDAAGLHVISAADVPADQPVWFRADGAMADPALAAVRWKSWRRGAYLYELAVDPGPAGLERYQPYFASLCRRLPLSG